MSLRCVCMRMCVCTSVRLSKYLSKSVVIVVVYVECCYTSRLVCKTIVCSVTCVDQLIMCKEEAKWRNDVNERKEREREKETEKASTVEAPSKRDPISARDTFCLKKKKYAMKSNTIYYNKDSNVCDGCPDLLVIV